MGKVQKGINDLQTWCLENGEFGQQLLQEWTGQCITNGKHYNTDEVTKASSKKFRWQCSKDPSHIWNTRVANRTNGIGCPYCSGRKVSKENSLLTWCISNGKFGQQLLQEWTGQCLDDNKQYTPEEVTRGTAKKFRWRCSKNPSHIWDAIVLSRTQGRGCPYCNRVSEDNSLLTWCQTNDSYGQQILQEWTGQCISDNKQYKTDEVAKASKKKFKWRCSKDTSHIWDATVSDRTNGHGCPHCYKENKSEIISFSKLKCGVNDLQTWCQSNGSYGQQLLQEWTGQCLDDNKQYTLDGIAEASNKKFKWKCFKNPSHIWDAIVNNRTNGSGCPYCNKYGTSYPEQVIYRSLKQVFPNTFSRGKFQGYEFDISIPEIKTRIEYSGISWHEDKLDRDNEKAQLCKDNNVNFIQIYAHCGKIKSEDIYEPNFILYKVDNNNHNNQLKNIVSQILTQFNHSIDEVDFNKACEEAFEYEGSVQEGVNDLKTWCKSNGSYGQQLLNEWTGQCITNGKYYNPDEVARAANKKFRWQCSKDPSHIWDAAVSDRTNGHGCPYCAGQKVSTENSLLAWCQNNGSFGQQLLQEWTGLCIDDNKQYTTDEVAKGTSKRFKWQCSKDPSHIWDAKVVQRTYKKSDCPYCAGTKVSKENSLLTWCQSNGEYGQQLLQEWTGLCLDDNKTYTPEEVTKATAKKFRWKCSKDPSHIWDAKVANRTRGTGCPHCRKPKP